MVLLQMLRAAPSAVRLALVLVAGAVLRAAWGARGRSVGRRRNAVAFVVWGEVARSPRMQNHAIAASKSWNYPRPESGSTGAAVRAGNNYYRSFFGGASRNDSAPGGASLLSGGAAQHPSAQKSRSGSSARGPAVLLVGLRGAHSPHPELSASSGEGRPVCLALLADVAPRVRQRLGFVLGSALRAIFGAVQLAVTLLRYRPAVVIVQNPPAIPPVPVLLLYRFFFSAFLIVDWHNYGYTILAMRRGENHPFVRLYRWLEFACAAPADHHLTVTRALKNDLVRKHGLPDNKITVLYDRPVRLIDSSLAMKNKLRKQYLPESVGSGWTPLVITATSYTADEKVELLLDAAKLCDQRVAASKLHVAVTGSGPGKADFAQKIAITQLENVSFSQLFVPEKDYLDFVAAADVGVCLHVSSSGLDLPMKLVDLVAAGVPALCYNYPVLEEEAMRAPDGATKNIQLFKNAEELSESLMSLLRRNGWETGQSGEDESEHASEHQQRKIDNDDPMKKAREDAMVHREALPFWQEDWDRTLGNLLCAVLPK